MMMGLAGKQVALTDGIDLIHEDDAWLVVTGVVEHLSDQPSTLTDVFIHDRAGHHLQHFQTSDFLNKFWGRRQFSTAA